MSKTIRMTKARKNELQLRVAADGAHLVRRAIAAGFIEAHKDVENVMLVNGDQPHTQKKAMKGLSMNEYSIGNSRQANVTHRCEWTDEYIQRRIDSHIQAGHKGQPYIGNAGTHGILNNKITDDEGIVQMWGNGFQPSVKHQYAWQPHVEAGLMRFLRNTVTATLKHAQEDKLTYRQQNLISELIAQAERVSAYIKLDRTLYSTDAVKLVSKRANPYDHTHFVIRSDTSYSDTDYSTYELLKLPYSTTNTVSTGLQTAIKLMRSLNEAVIKSVRAGSDTTHNAQQLKKLQDNLLHYQTQLSTRIDAVKGEWGSLEAAIKMDAQQRTEVVDYLKALPHKHLLNMSMNAATRWFGNETEMTTIQPNPAFILANGLGADIKAREELIENTKRTIRIYEAKVEADTGNLRDLKMQVAVGELKQFATAAGWINQSSQEAEE
jgi:hypothetical protein